MSSQRLRIVVLGTTLVLAGCGAAATPSPPATSPGAPLATSPGAQATMQLMGRGQLHDVDGTATGEAQLIVAPDGTYEVVLESFSIASIAHTNVALVKNADVTATGDIDKSMLLDLGPLKSTSGMQDFKIPADMAGGVMDYHTVVIWDTEMAHAIAAAPLG
jgi:Electron transfer DM13